jgi:hypothetical protein
VTASKRIKRGQIITAVHTRAVARLTKLRGVMLGCRRSVFGAGAILPTAGARFLAGACYSSGMRAHLLFMLPLLLTIAPACGDGGTGGAGGSGATTTTGTGGAGTGGGTGGSAPCGALPTEGVYAKFDVVGETYHASITNPMGIDQAIALWKGTSTAAIPNGKAICAPVPWNCPWTFHQDPASITFAELTIEVCDGTPSYVQDHCADFANGYCPWSAKLVELRDCRTDAACPVVPK